jgi:CRISPR-associated protein Csb2
MSGFQIRVTWPDGTYHGGEWPPAPLRLYQALLAGYRSGRAPEPALDAALRHLETLDPPSIQTPPVRAQAPVAVAVPNNDGDIILGHWAKGADDKARHAEAAQRTIRTRRPWRFDGPVTYTWTATPETAQHLPALDRLARCLSALGQGTDLAWAALSLDPTGTPVGGPGIGYHPRPAGGHWLTVPYPGVLDVLEERYQALRHRIQGGAVQAVPEPDHQQVRYRGDLDPPDRHWALFSLEEPDTGRPWSAAGTRLLDLAAMTRHAIHEAARRAGLGDAVVAALLGHGGPDTGESDRILIHPLPNIGHLYADGRLRRVLLCAPVTLDLRLWHAVVYRLTGSGLIPPGLDAPQALLIPVTGGDRLIGRFVGPSVSWTTATPIVLPGQDHRRGKPRPGRALTRLLRHAGIPEALLEEATFAPVPRLRGSPRARDCRLPAHLAGRPTAHLSLRWKVPVPGPIALGAGAGYGFGVLATC